jgi:hypothetical protein
VGFVVIVKSSLNTVINALSTVLFRKERPAAGNAKFTVTNLPCEKKFVK